MLCIIPVAAQPRASTCSTALARHLATIRKDESVVRFFETHAWLLTDARFAEEANLRLSQAKRRLTRTQVAATRTRDEARRPQAASRCTGTRARAGCGGT